MDCWLIIAHGGRYHSLIGGLSRIDSFVDQRARAGGPVGQATAGWSGVESIYVEMRNSGEPTNLLPWLADR